MVLSNQPAMAAEWEAALAGRRCRGGEAVGSGGHARVKHFFPSRLCSFAEVPADWISEI